MKALHVRQIQQCRGSTGAPLTARVAARGISNPAQENFRTPVCNSCDVNSRADLPTVFQNSALLKHMCTNKFNLTTPTPPEDKSLLLSLVSVWGERPNNSVFLSSSWKSSCTMFVLCKAAINGSRRAAKHPGTAGQGGLFPPLLQNKKGMGDLSEMGVSWMTPPPLKGHTPHVNSYRGHCEQLCWYWSLIGDFFPFW